MPTALPSALIWGLLERGIALVYFISFASLATQLLALAGSKGILPIALRLERARRDFPTFRRYFYFPTLLWIDDSDATLGAIPWLGMIASLAAIGGGPASFWAFLACYLLYLSLDRVSLLMYPWDCVLFEAGFFALFLPKLLLLPDLAAVSAPLPALAWVYRLLLFRVMLGFGKFKFVGSTSRDLGYLKGFFISQPLPSPIGWLAQKLPMWMLKSALHLMFVIEIPAAFTVFFPGSWSIAGALSTDLLMLAIWASGTFGYFNLIMMVVSLSWFDTATARAFSFGEFFSLEGPVFVHALVFLHALGALISFPFNSFCATTWLLWSPWLRIRPRWLTAPIAFYRFLHPCRWLHAYGVFPPGTTPSVKVAPVMEVTWDERHWETIEHVFSPTNERTRPTFCAPHQARLDQALIYEGFGLNEASPMRNLVGWWEPYGHGRSAGSSLLMQRILEGVVPGTSFCKPDVLTREKGPPRAARVRSYMLEPVSLHEMRTTGRWWKRTLIGPHIPPARLAENFWEDVYPPPERWHFDDVVWLKRSWMGPWMERARKGENPHTLVLTRPEELREGDLDRFWNDFLPTVSVHDKQDWRGLRRVVEEIREKYGKRQVDRFERITGRYGVLLFAKLEPLFLDKGIRPMFGKVKPTLDVKTYYHLGLLTRHIISEGKDAYDGVMREPLLSIEHAQRMTMHSSNYLDALFRYEVLVFQAQKLRLLDRYVLYENRATFTPAQKAALERVENIGRRIFGAMDVVDFLKTQFKGIEDVLDIPEDWPLFAMNDEGEVLPVPRGTTDGALEPPTAAAQIVKAERS